MIIQGRLRLAAARRKITRPPKAELKDVMTVANNPGIPLINVVHVS